jgi:hypothetical protein
VTVTLKEMRAQEQIRYATPTRMPVDFPPVVPVSIQVTGQQGLIRVQWAPLPNVDGYDVAIMTTPNLDAPDVNIDRKMGEKNREYLYATGNVAVTRYFALRSMRSGYFSDWSAPISGTSVAFGAVEAPPATPPAPPPAGGEPPTSGSGISGGRGRYAGY